MYETSEGFVPHYKFRGLECPVKIVTAKDDEGRNILVIDLSGRGVVERDLLGRRVFALPGGGVVSEGMA